MIAVDTSIVVAAFASWHEAHRVSVQLLDRRPRLPAHALIESYSVLTRLPAPHRAGAAIVAEFLAERFALPPLVLPGGAHTALVAAAAKSQLIGGAVYDALIAATAKHAGAVLHTRDRRAVPTYERIGVRYEMLA